MTRCFSAERCIQSKPWRISKPRSPRANGELPPGSTGLFHLVIVYHSGQNRATYLRANNNNAAPQFSPSEASTDYRIKIDPITRLLRESNTISRS